MIDKMIFFLIFHFLGDFCFQNTTLVQKKDKTCRYLFVHCIIYSVLFILPILISFNLILGIIMIIVLTLSHFLTDYFRMKLDKKNNSEKFHYYSFIIDQLIHITMIFIIVFFANNFDKNINIINDLLINQNINVSFQVIIRVLFSIILVLSPTSIFIKHTFNYLFSKDTNLCIDEEEIKKVNIGSIIGILERLIIILLGILGLYTSIAIVLTAKSIARYKTINDNPEFAEKYLVGTLLSLLIAVMCLFILKI